MTSIGPAAEPAAVGGQRMHALIARARPSQPMVTAVVHPVDAASLGGAIEAAQHGLITPLLVGPDARIRAAAEAAKIDITGMQIVSTRHSDAAAERAVALVRSGEAGALMKGALHTAELMTPVVARTGGLRTARRMSHVFVIDEPTYPRLLLVTDAAINIYPDLETKRDIVQNAADLAHALGIELPRIAVVCAVETVTAKLQSTCEAAALCKMADRGQITGAVLDGPLAFDNAVSPQAARAKHICSDVAGQADVLVVPDLESGNMLAKQLEYLASAQLAGVVLGARVPIMLTSRADSALSRLASAAVAALYRQWQLEQDVIR
ncbi:MAG: bifunctional enoyl-CoA hydratase/phosphate acetyltransferase [Salinisphaera sp.]|nr:bifunctional enoyl-CoA hydratase/phosphate acetyltransferase [Salinisphaera sp.]